MTRIQFLLAAIVTVLVWVITTKPKPIAAPVGVTAHVVKDSK